MYFCFHDICEITVVKLLDRFNYSVLVNIKYCLSSSGSIVSNRSSIVRVLTNTTDFRDIVIRIISFYIIHTSISCRMSEEKVNNGHRIEEEIPKGYKVEEIEINVPWGHVAGRWWGPRDKQPIIAIHGWQDNAGTWDNLIPLLPVNTSVLCLDLPGHGLSSHYPKGMVYYIFWDGVYLLRRIIKHFKWSKVTLMGHSLGGALSFMYAATFPDDTDRIICVDIASPAVREPGNMVKHAGWGVDKYLDYENLTEDKIPCYSYEEMIDIVCDAYKGSVSRENCCVLMKRGMMPTPAHTKKKGFFFKRDPRLKVSGLAMMSIETALEFASKVKCKVLNLRALPGQKWEKIDYYMEVIEKLKQVTEVQYIEVEGTHHVQLEAPENIITYIEDFLEIC